MVECIAPVDERTLDDAGNYVHAIPDYILGWLLRELHEKKGHNITVIFDSCFSGGLGRDVGRGRNAQSFSVSIPLDLDADLWNGKVGTETSPTLWSSSATTHVLLAACREDETAREIPFADGLIHGRFTESLIKTLRGTPVCGGRDRYHLISMETIPPTGRGAIALHRVPNSPQSFRVYIGSVEGVVPGTEFAVHAQEDNRFVCTLVADSVFIHQTTLIKAKASTARVADWKNDGMTLHVHLAPDFPYTADIFPTNATHQRHRFVEAASLAEAGISLRTDGSEIVIQALTSTIMECHSESRFKLGAQTSHLPAVLDGVAHFNYFLERHNRKSPLAVTVEVHQLVGEWPGRKPHPNGNLVRDMEALLPSDPTARYGFIVKNSSTVDLFPYLLYFNPGSIQSANGTLLLRTLDLHSERAAM
ncbi:hypothetical protein B0H14DRAFT_3883619 [Mycena olivaceomarginata]|nr:hypothetical protein B0H14DRAFT_3883619 [Mycena olivaceomarginata]